MAKCFQNDSECRKDCELYNSEYRRCSFYVLTLLVGICVKQIQEATEMIETAIYDMLQYQADNYYQEGEGG